jgi:hypothetical protein
MILADKARLNIAKPLSHNRRPFDLRLFENFILVLTLTRQDFHVLRTIVFYFIRIMSASPYRLSGPEDGGGRWLVPVSCDLNMPA